MKKSDVKVGGVYAAKVTGKVVSVRIDSENPRGGWDGTNQTTGKKVRIKSVQRLRGPWEGHSREHMQGVHKADQENARLAEEREKSPDGQAASERAMATSAPKAKKASKAKSKTKKTPKRSTGERGAKGAKQKRPSLLNLAAKVLADAGEPMSCKQMVESVLATGLWQTSGKTPQATLFSAIHRECRSKGNAARFKKVDKGKFEAATK